MLLTSCRHKQGKGDLIPFLFRHSGHKSKTSRQQLMYMILTDWRSPGMEKLALGGPSLQTSWQLRRRQRERAKRCQNRGHTACNYQASPLRTKTFFRQVRRHGSLRVKHICLGPLPSSGPCHRVRASKDVPDLPTLYRAPGYSARGKTHPLNHPQGHGLCSLSAKSTVLCCDMCRANRSDEG